MRPGTVKAYLSSVENFLKFIIQKVADETKEFPSIDERSLRLTNYVLNHLPDWRTAISRKFSHKKWERVLEVSRRLPPACTINDLMSTVLAKEAITILNKSSTGHLVSSREFIYKSFKVYSAQSKSYENKTEKTGNLARSSKYHNSFKTVYSHSQTRLSVRSLNYNTYPRNRKDYEV